MYSPVQPSGYAAEAAGCGGAGVVSQKMLWITCCVQPDDAPVCSDGTPELLLFGAVRNVPGSGFAECWENIQS